MKHIPSPIWRQRFTALMACTAIACSAGTACAQSTVSIFGTVDVNLTYAKVGNQSSTSLSSGGNLVPSRFGFRGSEDLGDGLSASFWLESQFLTDTGALETATFFHRRSTVSLSSRAWGEVRAGRDYVPTFWNVSQFAPFGTPGVGGSQNIIANWPLGVGGARNFVRTNNTLGYFLPRDLGGVYGQAMYAAPEGIDGTGYRGVRVGYASGPFDVAVAYGNTPAKGQTSSTTNIGASYDLGFAKLMGYAMRQRSDTENQNNWLIGAIVPVGLGSIRLSYGDSKGSGTAANGDSAKQYAAGYAYALSKRTSLYTAYSHITNKGKYAFVTTSLPAPAAGQNASGLQFGVTHSF